MDKAIKVPRRRLPKDTTVESRSSVLLGQEAFFNSTIISREKRRILRLKGFFGNKWQERRDSNPQLTVLETVALPIELS